MEVLNNKSAKKQLSKMLSKARDDKQKYINYKVESERGELQEFPNLHKRNIFTYVMEIIKEYCNDQDLKDIKISINIFHKSGDKTMQKRLDYEGKKQFKKNIYLDLLTKCKHIKDEFVFLKYIYVNGKSILTRKPKDKITGNCYESQIQKIAFVTCGERTCAPTPIACYEF